MRSRFPIFLLLSLLLSRTILAQQSDSIQLNEYVYTGSLKEMRKAEFAIPVEIFTKEYFLQNNVTNLYEAMRMMNGIQPNIDGAVDGSGDIELNGMEGHYTLILIDNNPISGGNASMYGLMGIPITIVERIEVIKGPASTLYGSDAMAGVINVITKSPSIAPRVFVEERITTYAENNAELGIRLSEQKVEGLLSVSAYNSNNRWDKDADGFMDMPVINRVAAFGKFTFRNRVQKQSSIYARYVYEDRMGGEMDFKAKYRGGDYIYGESARTNRFEVFGNFLMPFPQDNVLLQLSFTNHDQHSTYGVNNFNSTERNTRAQLTWDKKIAGKTDLMVGAVYRLTWYDDNLPATLDTSNAQQRNAPLLNHFPAVFIQDILSLNAQNELLAGVRYEFNSLFRGSVIIPRIDYRYSSKNKLHSLRIGAGSGFRTPNLFIDDRYAFINGKKIELVSEIKTELAFGAIAAYSFIGNKPSHKFSFDAKPFFTVILNKIEADRFAAENTVIYSNENTIGFNYGININADVQFSFPLRAYVAFTLLQNVEMEREDEKVVFRDVLNSPLLNANFSFSYQWEKAGLIFDWNGVLNSPMRLATVPNDYRDEYSPWFSIMNIQITKRFHFGLEIYAGVNNLLDVKPSNVLLRANDPFNNLVHDLHSNPLNYRFNANYIYAPNQGIKGFFGVRYMLR